MRCKGIRGSCGDRSTWERGSNKSQDLGPEEHNLRNTLDPAQDPQAPTPLVEDPRLKKTQDCPKRANEEYFSMYVYDRDVICIPLSHLNAENL